MTKSWTEPESRVAILGTLGGELERASARMGHRVSWKRASLRSGPRTTAVALVALLCLGGAAVAATGILSTHVTIPAGKPSGPPENRKTVSQTVLAQGTAPVAGPWRITTYGSEGVADDGEVLEPRGLPCIELSLIAPPKTPLLATSYCGKQVQGEFTTGSLPVKEPGGEAELILFGSAPEQAATVTLVADGSTRVPVRVFDGPESYSGNIWAAVVPPGFERAEVEWLAQDGKSGGPPRDISDTLSRLERVRQAFP